ncbi:MAG: acyl-phosphate glycerol 3-phosphate acyltransferase [Alcanivorax sp.]|uniref:glycerol-3-phosphate 1-O-acyltransferase PlsY n=1 Tax=Alloalcanivorax profundimaris TaxID=2735259 RepID=UPI000C62E3A6|nr:glycerol-3-phosphate 1-O-acyltransferase PlsY [Alloalcanivorax profundimaris]MBU58123.1 acyl-phosphate glycerol 3-phosphate acyltransferase [Alcanivorax sp.]
MDTLALQESGVWLLPLCAAAYLLGSISSAILVCRLFGYPDPRTEGSSNPGATNVLRIGGKPAAALTLLGDVLKGTIPVAVAYGLGLSAFGAALVGFCAFLGHLFPVFFQFRGGKGVATAFGLLFPLHWPTGLVAGAVWLAVFALTRISSVASLSAFVAAPISLWFWLPAAFWPMVALTAIMVFRHRTNLAKLLSGEELGFRRKG